MTSMNTGRAVRGWLFGIGMMTLVGCGPMFQTQYTYVPPSSETGRTCVFQCENSRYQCQQLEEMRKERCEEDARREQERCQWQLAMRGKEEKWYDCPTASCSADTERCDGMYRSCYQSCGGRVDAKTVCVANCDQIPPASTGAGIGTTQVPQNSERRY